LIHEGYALFSRNGSASKSVRKMILKYSTKELIRFNKLTKTILIKYKYACHALFDLLSKKPLEIIETESEFVVKIPLL
jgi:hypothetical protein